MALRTRPLDNEEIVSPNAEHFEPVFPAADVWFEIYMSEHERRRGRSANLPPLKLDDLSNHYLAVLELGDELVMFYHDVLKSAARRTRSAVLTY